MTVNVKFIGSFRGFSGRKRLELKLGKTSSIEEVVKSIVKQVPNLREALIAAECGSPKASMLVLLNGKEISVLDRFETRIKDGDEIVFVPVVHGG